MAKFFKTILALVFAVSLIGCSSDETTEVQPQTPSKTVSGTAAGGLPVVGLVSARGANGVTVESTILSDGSYSLNVNSLTAPYVLRAYGTVGDERVHLYSTGVAEGNINITPITSMITNRIMGGDLEDKYRDWSSESASITVDESIIEAAEAAVQAQLAPILEAYGIDASTDLMSVDFDADHSGLDAVLDILDIEIDDSSDTVTVTNTTTGTTITDTADGTSGEGFTEAETTAIQTILSDLTGIQIFAETFNSLFAGATLPSANELDTNLAPRISTYFLAWGEDKDTFLTELISDDDSVPPGIAMSPVIDASFDYAAFNNDFSTNYTAGYWVNLFFTLNGETIGATKWAFAKDALNNWIALGDRAWAYGEARATNFKSHWAGTGTGYRFQLWDREYAVTTKNIETFIVRGPGLPDSGLIYYNNVGWFSLHPDRNNSFCSDIYWDDICVIASNSAGDALLDSIPDNSVYTFDLYTDSSTDVAYGTSVSQHTIEKVIPTIPYKSTELSQVPFATITSPTSFAGTNIGGDVTVNWTVPAAATGWQLDWVHVGWGNSSDWRSVEEDGDDFGTTAIRTATLDTSINDISYNNVWIEVNGKDEVNRLIISEIGFSGSSSQIAPSASFDGEGSTKPVRKDEPRSFLQKISFR
jgi:hypothetical protein